MNRDNIKAANGIGPGATNTRANLEERNAARAKAHAKMRESEQRRANNPGLHAYTRILRCDER